MRPPLRKIRSAPNRLPKRRRETTRINSNPSVTTVNHTKATICLVEEISLDTGTYVIPEVQNSAFKQSFSRAQFGITLNITPRVNIGLHEETNEASTYFITLETDVVSTDA